MFCHDCVVQHVVTTSSSVTQADVFQLRGFVMVTMTAKTGPMNRTAVSDQLFLATLQFPTLTILDTENTRL